MHSIKNISESNKIDTQSRSVAYNRRKRFISKTDYNFLKVWMHLKVFLKLKNPKNSLLGKKTPKNTKKTKKPKKKPKNPLGWIFFKSRVFSNPDHNGCVEAKNGALKGL
jgi:hypothetical protein